MSCCLALGMDRRAPAIDPNCTQTLRKLRWHCSCGLMVARPSDEQFHSVLIKRPRRQVVALLLGLSGPVSTNRDK